MTAQVWTRRGSPVRFVAIGNPDNRRMAFFRDAVVRAGLSPPTILSYVDLLAGRAQLCDHLAPGAILRIESPGEDWEVERALLRVGAEEAGEEGSPFLDRAQIDRLRFDRGLILHPRQWYLGFRNVLRKWGGDIADCGGVLAMNSPAEIGVMFDKTACHARLADDGVPVPDSLNPVRCYDELVMRMVELDMTRVFVKPAHGSSASGVVALQRTAHGQMAVTSAEIVRNGDLRLYNSLKIRRYTKLRDVADLIDAICAERAHVEKWLPKASLDGRNTFDLRIVMIGGEARHLIVRQGRGPMTNLHLGNQRGNRDHLMERLGSAGWEAVQETCRNAMQLFPHSLYAGLDVLLMPGFRRHALLEMNAFGDLLPGVLSRGENTCEAEIEAIAGTVVRG